MWGIFRKYICVIKDKNKKRYCTYFFKINIIWEFYSILFRYIKNVRIQQMARHRLLYNQDVRKSFVFAPIADKMKKSCLQ